MAAILAAGGAMLAPGLGLAKPLPQPVADMIDAAASDPAALKAVVAAAKKTNPDSLPEIDAQVMAAGKRVESERQATLATQGFFDGWKGKGELGASLTTGNSNDANVAIGLNFSKQTLKWRHVIDATADYARDGEAVSKERYFGVYSANYQIIPRLYAVSTLAGEVNRFEGIHSRFTEALGLGYRVFDSPALKLNFEASPALRQTDFTDTGHENRLTARLAQTFAWTFTPGTVLNQSVTAYVRPKEAVVTANTSLTVKLLGAIAARGSFEVRYMSDPHVGRTSVDTTTRTTLVYDF
jgi:putative salt-induced outer membrane protein